MTRLVPIPVDAFVDAFSQVARASSQSGPFFHAEASGVFSASSACAEFAISNARISRRPGVCGGDPCIEGTRIPIWLIERARQLGVSNKMILAMYPALDGDDLRAAWEYVRAHHDEIRQQIRENESA